jgi:hypothetical protein
MKNRLGYLWVFPWEFERLGAGVQSMLGFIVAIGVGVPLLRDLGWISGSAWPLLIVVPAVAAGVAIEKMQARYKRTAAELQAARILLRRMDVALPTENDPGQEQNGM